MTSALVKERHYYSPGSERALADEARLVAAVTPRFRATQICQLLAALASITTPQAASTTPANRASQWPIGIVF